MPVVVPVPAPSPTETADFDLYANGAAGVCPEGNKAVSEEECLEAAQEVGTSMTLKDFLNVGTWDFTPCGCFIYINNWVDYKNPEHGNCNRILCAERKPRP